MSAGLDWDNSKHGSFSIIKNFKLLSACFDPSWNGNNILQIVFVNDIYKMWFNFFFISNMHLMLKSLSAMAKIAMKTHGP